MSRINKQRLTEAGRDGWPSGQPEAATVDQDSSNPSQTEVYTMSFTIISKQVLAVTAVAAAAVLSAGSALAQEATPDNWTQITASKSRADVRAELVEARRTGLTRAWSAGYIEPLRSQRVRAEVKADTARAIASGELKAINAEVYNFTPEATLRLAQAGK